MNIGKIVQVIGPVVDLAFEEGQLPNIMNAIAITNPTINDQEDNLIVEVAQHLGDNVVRCIAMDITDGLVRGMKAKDLGGPISVPVGPECLGRIPREPARLAVHQRDEADDVAVADERHVEVAR